MKEIKIEKNREEIRLRGRKRKKNGGERTVMLKYLSYFSNFCIMF